VIENQIIARVRNEGRTWLTEIESKELLREAGINVADTRMAKSKDEAIRLSQELGFPVVLKVVSPAILHKSDAGGVKVGLRTAKQVAKAYDDIWGAVGKKHLGAVIEGVSVQQMARPGVEVIIGMSKDIEFGPLVMFGLGGIWVEVLKDVSFRIAPLTRRDAREMIREVKGYPLLEGYRGKESVDVSNLEDYLLKVSDFVERNPEIKELDLNPIFAYSDSAVAVDARVILESLQNGTRRQEKLVINATVSL
jgi:acetyl-CoA synthetase (ADP-forming)